MANPIANADQLAGEQEVLTMWQAPQTRIARDHAAQMWRLAHGSDVPSGVEGHFDAAMDAWVTNYLFKAAAADPVHPRFVRNFMPAHDWFGRSIPDARMGGDNPDNCYRLAGIRHGLRYRVTGRVLPAQPAQVSFTLVENWGTSITVQTIELPGIDVDDDGGFTITIDDQPSAGRKNHLTTNPRVKFLFVRDSMMDWARETPVQLAIERADIAAATPVSLDERLDDALRRVREDVGLYYWFVRLNLGNVVNTMPPAKRSGAVGGLVTQAGACGLLHIEDDQAAIVRFDPAGAAYSSLELVMWWYQSIDAHRIQSTLNGAQARADSDRMITAVVSAQDPGVAHWVQTNGFKDLLPILRWQALGSGEPSHSVEIVPFNRLDQMLPLDTPRMTASERTVQIQQRQDAWRRRIAED